MSIFLNGRYMTGKEAAHAYLKRRLHFPDYYGANLDALYDLLTTWVKGEIVLKNSEVMLENLGEYGQAMLDTFADAAENSRGLSFSRK